MLKSARIRNFKSIREVELEFGDLTVLIGHNNSGKSAAIEALMYYKEAAETYDEDSEVGALSYRDIDDVDFVGYDFSNTREILHRNRSGRAEYIAVEPLFDLSGFPESDLLLSGMQSAGLNPDGVSISIGAELYENDLRQTWTYLDGSGDVSALLEPTEGESLTGQNVDFTFPISESGTIRASNQGLLHLEDVVDDAGSEFTESAQNLVGQKLRQTYYITDRRDIEKWDDDPHKRGFVGNNGEHTVSMLHALRDDQEAFNHVVEAVDDIAESTNEVVADMHKDRTKTELIEEDTGEKFNIVASGSGIRRLLPIIVQIAAMEDGSTLILEEPEISVFPKTQGRFLKYLIEELRSRDIQVIMTTHSWSFQRKLMNIVGDEGEPDLGHGLYFEKNDGETEVERRALNRLGLNEDQWNEG